MTRPIRTDVAPLLRPIESEVRDPHARDVAQPAIGHGNASAFSPGGAAPRAVPRHQATVPRDERLSTELLRKLTVERLGPATPSAKKAPTPPAPAGPSTDEVRSIKESIENYQVIIRGEFDRAYVGQGMSPEAIATQKANAQTAIDRLNRQLTGEAPPVKTEDVRTLAPVPPPPRAPAGRPASWGSWPNQQGLMDDASLRQTFAKDDPFYLPPGDYGTSQAARDRIMLPVAGLFQTYEFGLDTGAATQGVPVTLNYDQASFANMPDAVRRGDIAQAAAPLIRAAFERVDAKQLGLQKVNLTFVSTPGASKPTFRRSGDTITMSADFATMSGLYDQKRHTKGEAYTGQNDFIGEYQFQLRGLSMGGAEVRPFVDDFAAALSAR